MSKFKEVACFCNILCLALASDSSNHIDHSIHIEQTFNAMALHALDYFTWL
jgi:hypothetical protein